MISVLVVAVVIAVIVVVVISHKKCFSWDTVVNFLASFSVKLRGQYYIISWIRSTKDHLRRDLVTQRNSNKIKSDFTHL